MRPTPILAIVNEIILNERQMIVECGSGNSTVFAARALSQGERNAHIYSVDHDPRWAMLTNTAIAREGLQSWASVTCAPLVDGWYDRTLLPQIEDIDLLVVDGPPAVKAGNETARLPALYEFSERLKPRATIVLDDCRRKGEKRVLAAWEKSYAVTFNEQRGGYATATWPRGAE